MPDPNLSSFIWSVADLLRGDYKQSESKRRRTVRAGDFRADPRAFQQGEAGRGQFPRRPDLQLSDRRHRCPCHAEGDAALYARARALLPPDLLAWAQETQPQAWETLTKQQGSAAEATLLDRARAQLAQLGTLDVLRNRY